MGAFGLSLLGLTLGAAIGVLGLMAPTFAIVLVALASVWFLRARPGFWAPAGILIGAGLSWLFLLWRALSSCRTIQTENYYSDCRPPDVTPYIGAAVAFVVVGSVLLIVATVLQWRRRHQTN
jgi:hypothetical protein